MGLPRDVQEVLDYISSLQDEGAGFEDLLEIDPYVALAQKGTISLIVDGARRPLAIVFEGGTFFFHNRIWGSWTEKTASILQRFAASETDGHCRKGSIFRFYIPFRSEIYWLSSFGEGEEGIYLSPEEAQALATAILRDRQRVF